MTEWRMDCEGARMRWKTSEKTVTVAHPRGLGQGCSDGDANAAGVVWGADEPRW